MSEEPLPTTVIPPPGPPSSSWSALPGAAAQVTAGSLVARTLQVWWRHLGPYSLMSLLSILPMVAGFAAARFPMALLTGARIPPEELRRLFAAMAMPAAYLPMALGALLSGLLYTAQYGGLIHGVVRHLSGGAAGLGELYRQGFRRLWSTFAAGILISLAVWIGLLLLVVPGVIAIAALMVAVPAAVVERPGAAAALRRSVALTRGRRLGLLGAFLVVLAVSTGVRLGANLLAVVSPLLGTLLGLALAVVAGSLPTVFQAVAFHDLRAAAEGADPASLARVFE